MCLEAEGVGNSDQAFFKRDSKGVIAGVFPCVQDGVFALHLQSENYWRNNIA